MNCFFQFGYWKRNFGESLKDSSIRILQPERTSSSFEINILKNRNILVKDLFSKERSFGNNY